MDAQQQNELIARCRGGDQAACRELYAACGGGVMAYLLRSGFARADAEDLLQETFSRVFRGLDTFDPQRGAFRSWLGTIARNVARRQWEKRRQPEAFDPELADEMFTAADNPHADPAHREALAAVRDCIGHLPGELRRIVELRYVEGRTTRGVAAEADLPEATARLRLAEAKAALETCLKRKGVFEA